jgi:NADH-quinone oxidoreductase subunit C
MIPSIQQIQAQFEQLVAQDPMPIPPPLPPVSVPTPPPASAPASASAPVAAKPSPPPALPAPPPPQVQATDFAARGVHLDIRLKPAQVVAAAQIMYRHGFGCDAVTGVDWLAAGEMEVVYDYFHPEGPFRVAIHARVPRATPELPTIREIFQGADWHERETHEFFGIKFLGHPNLTPLLLPEDADFHPLRKDYVP